MLNSAPVAEAPAWKVWTALSIVYVVWGSSYLAIAFALESLPPFLMAGVRFLLAGGALYAWSRLRGTPRPEPIHWRSAAVVGGLLLLGGNGGVVFAEQSVDSGMAAVLVATMPLWMALLPWFAPGGTRPEGSVLAGLGIGLAGVAVLVGVGRSEGHGVDPLGAAVLLAASLSWAAGSLRARTAPLPAAGLSTAMQMLAGGAMLVIVGTLAGEWPKLRPDAITARSLVALGYLVVFGSIVAFSAYVWVLRATTPARVSTYAYVNPVVAVVLGWALGGERLGWRSIVGTTIIVASVALIVGRTRARARDAEEPVATGASRS